MKYLKIANKGELDVRLISLMGGTTKRGNEYKIGKFGSGLKYALAWLIRNNIDFKIFVGEKQVGITTKAEVIQGTNFDVLYIEGERSSISSSMGLDWEAWMIVREIYCNALDEGSHVKELTEMVEGAPETTTFYIQYVDGIKEVVDKWDNYFLHKFSPIFETEKFAIYPPSEKLSIFKNGVLIHRDKEEVGMFSYDLKDASINELREYKGWMNLDIVKCIQAFDHKTIDLFLSSVNNEKYFESGLDYNLLGDSWHPNKETWKTAIGAGKVISKKDLEHFRARNVPLDEASMIVVPNDLYMMLVQKFALKGISAVRRADQVASFYETFDAELELKIKAGLAILESCNYDVHPELKFIYGEFGSQSVFARINIEEKVVMFSTQLKDKSMFEIVSCIIEENGHFLSGFTDCSREFQQYWINLYAKTLLDKNQVTL